MNKEKDGDYFEKVNQNKMELQDLTEKEKIASTKPSQRSSKKRLLIRILMIIFLSFVFGTPDCFGLHNFCSSCQNGATIKYPEYLGCAETITTLMLHMFIIGVIFVFILLSVYISLKWAYQKYMAVRSPYRKVPANSYQV